MIFAVFLCSVIGAVTARMDGGGLIRTHEWVERTLCIAPFVAVCIPYAGWYSLLAYLGVVGLLLGHGQYFLNLTPRFCSPERIDPLVKIFFGEDPRTNKDFEGYTAGVYDEYFKSLMQKRILTYGKNKLYWRCVFGMFIGGSLVGLPAAVLALCFSDIYTALILSTTGFVKSFAYMYGHYFFNNTESAEYMNGFLRNLIALLSLGVCL